MFRKLRCDQFCVWDHAIHDLVGHGLGRRRAGAQFNKSYPDPSRYPSLALALALALIIALTLTLRVTLTLTGSLTLSLALTR